jgi:DNA-binding XRE family transcriptional regulator
MVKEQQLKQRVEHSVRLLKRGDASSLKKLRCLLGKTRQELALDIGVTEKTVEMWEDGNQKPSSSNRAKWRIKLGSYIDKRISALLETEDNEISTKYWALIWELID